MIMRTYIIELAIAWRLATGREMVTDLFVSDLGVSTCAEAQLQNERVYTLCFLGVRHGVWNSKAGTEQESLAGGQKWEKIVILNI